MTDEYQAERLNFKNLRELDFCSALSKTIEAKHFVTACGHILLCGLFPRGTVEPLSTEREGNSTPPAVPE